MRSKNEIISAVLEAAENSGDIRAVIRTDLVPVREYLYSYNFCFIVNDTAKYDGDEVFGRCFGERILLFRGDRNYPDMFPGAKAHLMVFRDGVTPSVFVRDEHDADRFVVKPVVTGRSAAGWTAVAGLDEHDEVVARGVYELRHALPAVGGEKKAAGHFHADGTFHAGEDHE